MSTVNRLLLIVTLLVLAFCFSRVWAAEKTATLQRCPDVVQSGKLEGKVVQGRFYRHIDFGKIQWGILRGNLEKVVAWKRLLLPPTNSKEVVCVYQTDQAEQPLVLYYLGEQVLKIPAGQSKHWDLHGRVCKQSVKDCLFTW